MDITHGNPIYPVLRIFSKDESLSDAFLVVEGIVVTSIPGAITPYKCVKLLLAAYYVLDVSYPKQYLSFLSFLGEVILSADAKSSLTTYSKFMNRYRALPSQ